MSEIDIISDYVEGESTTTQKEIEASKEEKTETIVSTESKTVTQSIEKEYLEGASSTEYEELKQYGLSKPKKVIIRATLKND
jgi:hypothetical protein